jgi:hypothetical protein
VPFTVININGNGIVNTAISYALNNNVFFSVVKTTIVGVLLHLQHGED